MKIKSILSVFSLLLVCSACNKQEDLPKVDICTIENPLETIEWLRTIHLTFQRTASPYGTQIIQYNYKEECVFFIDDCHNCPDGLNVVYDAARNTICEFNGIGGLTCPDFETEATDPIVLWDNVQ